MMYNRLFKFMYLTITGYWIYLIVDWVLKVMSMN